jgi:hypothetical protein
MGLISWRWLAPGHHLAGDLLFAAAFFLPAVHEVFVEAGAGFGPGHGGGFGELVAVSDGGEEGGGVSEVEGVDDFAGEVADAFGEVGVAGFGEGVVEVGELVGVAAGGEAEGLEQVELVAGEEGDGKGASFSDELVRVVGVGEDDEQAGAIRDDGAAEDGDADLGVWSSFAMRADGAEWGPEVGEDVGWWSLVGHVGSVQRSERVGSWRRGVGRSAGAEVGGGDVGAEEGFGDAFEHGGESGGEVCVVEGAECAFVGATGDDEADLGGAHFLEGGGHVLVAVVVVAGVDEADGGVPADDEAGAGEESRFFDEAWGAGE